MELKKATDGDFKGRLEAVAVDMVTIMQCMEVLENSILHIPDRTDKDLSRPCAAAAELILGLISSCQEEIENIACEL